MFEHFTKHAQRVLELEGVEAQKMHHTYLGTEHLLLALVREPEGHGHRALAKLGVSYKQLRQTVSELVKTGPDTYIPDGFHQTPHIKHVMATAVAEARKLKHGHIGTEHLLLALLEEPEGVALRAIQGLGLKPQAVREEVLATIEHDHRQKDEDGEEDDE